MASGTSTVPTFDHRPRGEEFLKGELAEFKEFDQLAVLHVMPGHHQQSARQSLLVALSQEAADGATSPSRDVPRSP